MTITQDFGKGSFTNEENYRTRNTWIVIAVVAYHGKRLADASSIFKRNSTRLSYKHNFPQTGRELTADITYNHG